MIGVDGHGDGLLILMDLSTVVKNLFLKGKEDNPSSKSTMFYII